MSKDGSLPDGVTEDMIPGNSKDDDAFDQWFENELEELAKKFLDRPETQKTILNDVIYEELYINEFEKFAKEEWETRKG